MEKKATRAPRSTSPRWLLATIGATALVLLVTAIYVYIARFSQLAHADAAVTILLAAKTLATGLPYARDWYYANGDVWILAPHVVALLPVALFGVSLKALVATVLLGFTLELVALFGAFRAISGRPLHALFASVLVLIAWSRAHVLFVYVELSYGFVATLYVALFAWVALSIVRTRDAKDLRAMRRWAICAPIVFVLALQNPVRALPFVVAPLFFGLAWPWRDLSIRLRAIAASSITVGWLFAEVVYRFVLLREVTFSPYGHNNFAVRDLAGIGENIGMIGRGLVTVTGVPDDFGVGMIPGLLFLFGALAIVIAHTFAARTLTPIRFVSLVALAQLGAVVLPLVLGNLMIGPFSARYMMPSFLVIFGLAALIACRALETRTCPRLVSSWIVLAPLAAALSFARIVGATLEAANGQWANRAGHTEVASAMVARGLTRGYATYWNANLVTLLSNGRTQTCSVNFGNGIIPYRWLSETECFDRDALPERFYVIVAPEERENATRAMKQSLPEPIEKLTIGDGFEVSIYRSADTNRDWLSLPIEDGDALALPLRIPAAFPQLQSANATVDGEIVTATGVGGTILYGPYLRVPAGHYRVAWFGSGVASDGEVTFDVVSGSKTFAREVRPASTFPTGSDLELVRMDLDLETETPGIETRVFSGNGGKIALSRLELTRR